MVQFSSSLNPCSVSYPFSIQISSVMCLCWSAWAMIVVMKKNSNSDNIRTAISFFMVATLKFLKLFPQFLSLPFYTPLPFNPKYKAPAINNHSMSFSIIALVITFDLLFSPSAYL